MVIIEKIARYTSRTRIYALIYAFVITLRSYTQELFNNKPKLYLPFIFVTFFCSYASVPCYDVITYYHNLYYQTPFQDMIHWFLLIYIIRKPFRRWFKLFLNLCLACNAAFIVFAIHEYHKLSNTLADTAIYRYVAFRRNWTTEELYTYINKEWNSTISEKRYELIKHIDLKNSDLEIINIYAHSRMAFVKHIVRCYAEFKNTIVKKEIVVQNYNEVIDTKMHLIEAKQSELDTINATILDNNGILLPDNMLGYSTALLLIVGIIVWVVALDLDMKYTIPLESFKNNSTYTPFPISIKRTLNNLSPSEEHKELLKKLLTLPEDIIRRDNLKHSIDTLEFAPFVDNLLGRYIAQDMEKYKYVRIHDISFDIWYYIYTPIYSICRIIYSNTFGSPTVRTLMFCGCVFLLIYFLYSLDKEDRVRNELAMKNYKRREAEDKRREAEWQDYLRRETAEQREKRLAAEAAHAAKIKERKERKEAEERLAEREEKRNAYYAKQAAKKAKAWEEHARRLVEQEKEQNKNE